jgi:S1-C subfamily serine protease
MRIHLTGALLALLTLAPGVALAQGNADSTTLRKERRYRVRTMDAPRMAQLSQFMNHPRIGVMLTADSAGQGARIAEVVDDSPAEKAGLKAGDVITRFNDTDIKGDDAASTVSDLASDLDPGDTVKVEYRRDGARKTATIVADDMGGRVMALRVPGMRMRAGELNRLNEAMPSVWAGGNGDMARAFTVFGRGPMGLNLVEMNPGLGDYFGTSEGLLVTEEPADSTMPLRPGDVILSIDGRVPTSEMHARRILGSYAPGETVKFEIMRKKGKQTVEWKVGSTVDGLRSTVDR